MIGSTGALYFMEKDKIKELEQEIETHIKLNKQLLEDIDRAGKEIERLNNIINKIDKYANKLRYYADEDDDGYKISKDIHNILLQELKGNNNNE